MSSERLAGALMILAFVLVVAGSIAAPSSAYQGPIDQRLAVIDASHGQWVLSKIFDGVAIALLGASGLILAFGRSRGDWLRVAGGASLGVAGIVGLFYVYRLAADPGPLYDRDTPVPIVILLVSLTAIGLLALGLHLLRAGYPRWAGMTAAVLGTAALIGLALTLVLRRGPEPAFFVELVAFVGVLCMGITLVRQQGQPAVESLVETSRADGVR